MRRIAALFLLGALTVPAAAMAADTRQGVVDPYVFVQRTYQAFARSAEPQAWPAETYSRGLAILFTAYETWSAQQDGLIGALDFDWWVNAQDWGLADVSVRETYRRGDRRIETVRFTHGGERPDTLQLVFVREAQGWFLDDAIEGSGRDPGGWTLSDLLLTRPE